MSLLSKNHAWKVPRISREFIPRAFIQHAQRSHSTLMESCTCTPPPEASSALARAPPNLGCVPLGQAGAAVWPRGCAPRDTYALIRCAHPPGAPHGRNQPPPRHARGAEWPAITLLAAGQRAPGRQAAIPAGLKGAILPRLTYVPHDGAHVVLSWMP